MQRINDDFVPSIAPHVSLNGAVVLDIGCGNAKRSVKLAERVQNLTGIDPNAEKIAEANERGIANATFVVGEAQALPFADNSFDVVLLSQSLHHVPIEYMPQAIREAVRVTKPTGYIVILEIGTDSPFTDAEFEFGIADGDNRKEKAAVKAAITASSELTIEKDFEDETYFIYDSVDDFLTEMKPKRNQEVVKDFLEKLNNKLTSRRRIIVARPVK